MSIKNVVKKIRGGGRSVRDQTCFMVQSTLHTINNFKILLGNKHKLKEYSV